jgi:hypothetical protein
VPRIMTDEQTKRKFTIGEKLLAIVIIVVFLFAFYITLDANKYTATVHVIEGAGSVGVNPTTERLDFGDLSAGTSSVRRVTIENRTSIPMYVAVVKMGGINDLMKLDHDNFVLAPGKTESLEFTVYMPASAPVGETLTGRVYLFKIPGPWSAS